jgi:response regulator RpfG family c-di-GMP phosphodiesterase
MRGSHFDPEVVDCFLAIKDEMLAIKNKYKHKEKSLPMQIMVDAA